MKGDPMKGLGLQLLNVIQNYDPESDVLLWEVCLGNFHEVSSSIL